MKRKVVDASIMAIGMAPSDFREQAERAIATVPDEWEGVVVGPQFRYENEWPVEYIGAGWWFFQDGRYAAFITERPQDMQDAAVRKDYLQRVRVAFSREVVA